MSSPDAIITLFHGKDEPTLKKEFDSFFATISDPASVDFNTTRLDGDTIALGDIQSAANALPFLADLRVVIVENLADSKGGRDLIDKLADVFDALPESTRLIFLETNQLGARNSDSQAEARRKSQRSQGIKKLSNLIEKNPRGQVLSFDVPSNPLNWIKAQATHYGVEINGDAAQLLNDRIGENLVQADSELAKLATFCGEGGTITRDDVALLTPYEPDASIFDMVDALGRRDGGTAMRLLHDLLDSGYEPLAVLSMIQRQYRLLLLTREQVDKGQPANLIAKSLNTREWLVKKMAGQSRQYGSVQQLERVYRYLLSVDTGIKTGQVAPALALDELIARLAGG